MAKKGRTIIRRRMRDIKAEAAARRAKILAEYEQACIDIPGISFTEFGERYDLTGERVGQIVARARKDRQK